MKKNICVIMILLTSLIANAQEINHIVYDDMAEENILLGYFNREALNGDDFKLWFDAEYKSYSVDELTLKNIQEELISTLEIKLVMGTWCHDSQREVPRFLKIIDYLNFKNENLTMIGINRMKLADKTEVNELNVELVPTIIFYIKDKEIGRIIESPIESLEKDIIRILSFE